MKNIVDTYNKDGYVVIDNVFEQPAMEQAKAHIDQLQEKYPHLRPEQFGTGQVEMDKFWLELVSTPKLLDIVEQFIGPDIALFATHYIAKVPFKGQAVGWHQDGSFWPLDPMEVVTAWVAIDDSDVENGCLRVMPNTQTKRLLNKSEMDATPGEANALSAEMNLSASDLDESQAIDLIMKSGDIEIHHPNIVHGSNANKSPRWRRGLTIRYIPATTCMTNSDHPAPYFLRGKIAEGVNNYAPFPNS